MADDQTSSVLLIIILAVVVVAVVFVTWLHFFDKSGDREDKGFWKWLLRIFDVFSGL